MTVVVIKDGGCDNDNGSGDGGGGVVIVTAIAMVVMIVEIRAMVRKTIVVMTMG